MKRSYLIIDVLLLSYCLFLTIADEWKGSQWTVFIVILAMYLNGVLTGRSKENGRVR